MQASSKPLPLAASSLDKPERGASRVAWIIGEQVFRLGVGLVVGVGIARILGPYDFGRLSYAISVAAILGVAATLGFNRILVSELVRARDDARAMRELLQAAVLTRFLAAVLLNLIAGVVLWLCESGESALVSSLTLCFLFGAFDCIDLYFQAKLGTTGLIKARLLSFVAVSGIRLAMIQMRASVEAFALLSLLEAACGALAILLYLRRSEEGLSLVHARVRLGLSLLKESWPEIVAGFSGLLFMRMDQIMLQHMRGVVDVGQFAAAARISELWYFVPSGIVAAVYPNMLASKEGSGEKYLIYIRQLMGSLILLSYVAILCVSVGGVWVIGLIYGRSYLPAADILMIHIWCGIFVIMAMVSGMWLMAEKLMMRNMFRNIAGAALNAVLNIALIPAYGAKGAAWATLLAFVFAYFLYDFIDPVMRPMARLKLQSLLLWDAALWFSRRLKGS